MAESSHPNELVVGGRRNGRTRLMRLAAELTEAYVNEAAVDRTFENEVQW